MDEYKESKFVGFDTVSYTHLEDKALAQSFRDTLTPAEKAASAQQLGMLGGPELAQKYADKAICGEVFPYRPMGNIAMPGSTDVGDVSYVTPTAQMTALSLIHIWPGGRGDPLRRGGV